MSDLNPPEVAHLVIFQNGEFDIYVDPVNVSNAPIDPWTVANALAGVLHNHAKNVKATE